MDLVETLIDAQEIRHGRRKTSCGFMLAGFDPVALDIKGFEILKNFDPHLKNKKPNDILQIQFAQEHDKKGGGKQFSF